MNGREKSKITERNVSKTLNYAFIYQKELYARREAGHTDSF